MKNLKRAAAILGASGGLLSAYDLCLWRWREFPGEF